MNTKLKNYVLCPLISNLRYLNLYYHNIKNQPIIELLMQKLINVFQYPIIRFNSDSAHAY